MPAPALSRRRLLQTAFCSSAALALNLRVEKLAAAEATDHHLLAIGDFGSMEPPQTAVAKGMQSYVQGLGIKPEWLMLLGDNFYKATKGGFTPKSERWKTGFEDMYPNSLCAGPCPVVLGNHDYHDNLGGEQVQLAYAKGDTRWTLPSKWYRMVFPTKNPLVTFLFIDTNTKAVTEHGSKDKKERPHLTAEEETAQWAWLEKQFAGKRAPFTIVAGHHPVFSNGIHGDQKELVDRLEPMLEKAGVHAYMCGHDHDLQHLEMEGRKTSYVLSGGGGARSYPILSLRKAPYASGIYGFTHVQVNAQRLLFRHVDPNGKQVHAFEKRLDHSWSEVA